MGCREQQSGTFISFIFSIRSSTDFEQARAEANQHRSRRWWLAAACWRWGLGNQNLSIWSNKFRAWCFSWYL